MSAERWSGQEVAVIGVAGRFPGAADVDALWRLLCAGEEGITFFTPEELAAAGVPPALAGRRDYVPAAGRLDGVDRFDAAFFGMTPREAQVTDPQHRLFLEATWHGLESAGYPAGHPAGRTGVFASAASNQYGWRLLADRDLLGAVGSYRLRLGNEKDFLPTWVSYKLGLQGPSVNVQTACSSSLVAVHLACQSLLAHECDLAIAGGVAVRHLEAGGYLFQEGGVNSPDGRCRPFSAEAAGTVAGDGVGVVVLKRLAEALADGDTVHAIVRGSAINNDGDDKVGFTAPSLRGQARVVREALAVAGVPPREVGYVEAHGTATSLGDPIEVAALAEALGGRGDGDRLLGSIKGNIGHLDAAAGVAGLLKAVLALRHETVPPSLHFARPNPRIDFAAAGLRVAGGPTPWPRGPRPRYAGVSSFGIGGTNAHLVLEEAPAAAAPAEEAAGWHLLVASARTTEALDLTCRALADRLGDEPAAALADVAWTTQVGRRRFAVRRTAVGRTAGELAEALAAERAAAASDESAEPRVVFLFPGQGSQHLAMGAGAYRSWSVYRDAFDRCAERLSAHLEGRDLRRLVLPAAGEEAAAGEALATTAVAQPALFAVEYALARLWESWGVRPAAVLGHSLGELVAACVAGVFDLDDALRLVALRGRLMQEMPPGGMTAVELSADELAARLGPDVTLAAENAPDRSVAAGREEALADLEARLAAEGVPHRRLATRMAFHSPSMGPAAALFVQAVAECSLRGPEVPLVSAFTGRQAGAAEVADPGFWSRQLIAPVRFSRAVQGLLAKPGTSFLEVGPGHALTSLARRHGGAVPASPSLAHPRGGGADERALLSALGRLWCAGAEVDWPAVHDGRRRRRVPLPLYPFERRRHWAGAAHAVPPAAAPPAVTDAARDPDRWLYQPAWRSAPATGGAGTRPGELYLVVHDRYGVGERLAERLRAAGAEVVDVRPSPLPAAVGGQAVAAPGPGWRALLSQLGSRGTPAAAVHLAALEPVVAASPAAERSDRAVGEELVGVAGLAAAWAAHAGPGSRLVVASAGTLSVLGDEASAPERAGLAALVRVVRQELALDGRYLDLPLSAPPSAEEARRLAAAVWREIVEAEGPPVVAVRGERRWLPDWVALAARPVEQPPAGTWLITGGLGRVGLALAARLARPGVRLVLTRRRPLTAEETGGSAAEAGDGRAGTLAAALTALRAAGAEVEAVAADVTDREAMRTLIARLAADEALAGVVHAAGVTGAAARRAVEELDAAGVELHAAPKLRGLLVLDELLCRRPPRVCLLVSSLSAVLGGVGLAAYAAANACLDAFAAESRRRGGLPWVSVGWDGWRFARTGRGEPGIAPEEGGEVLLRLLAPGVPAHVVVAQGDLAARRHAAESVAARRPAAGDAAADAALAGDLRSDAERRVAAVWAELLGSSRIDRDDDFFELGGDSLLATRLVGRLRAVAGADLPLRAVFECPTVAALARRLEERRGEAAAELPPVEPAGRPAPLSFGQQRLWFLDQLERDHRPYNTLAALRLRGPLDVAALAAGFTDLVRRHEVLRTVIVATDDGPLQQVRPAAPVPLPRADLSSLPAAVRQPEARRLVRDEARRPFDLERGPLYRNTLLRLGPADHVLLIAAHHIVCDGWSVGVFRHELAEHYRARRRGGRAELPELPVQYADYAAWQRRHLAGERFDRQLAYWRSQLADLPVMDLPFDHPRPGHASFRGATETLRLGHDLSGGLHRLARAAGATAFMALLAVFDVLLQRLTGQDDVVVGSNIADRRRPELEGLIGFFVNNLVLRTDLSGDPTVAEVVERVRRVCLEAYANQDVPFERLVEELQEERVPGRHPLFQVLFVLQIKPAGSLGFGDLGVEPVTPRRQAAAFDLLLNVQEHDDGFFASLEYDRDLFAPETARALLARYRGLLAAAVERPDARLSELAEADDPEVAARIASFNDPLAVGA